MTALEVHAFEEEVLTRTPAVRAIQHRAVEDGRAEAAALVAQADDGRIADLEAALESARGRALSAYAAAVSGLLAPDDVARWTRLVSGLPSGRRAALPADAPGALGVLDAMEGVPDPEPTPGDPATAFAAIASRCDCGYAATGTLPRRKSLCMLCTITVLGLWSAEEQRLLGRAPAVAAAVDAALEGAVGEIAEVRHRGVAETRVDVERDVRARFGRRLRRANREHRAAIALLDTTRWDDLAEVAAHAAMTAPQHDARRARRWGLGTARLCALARLGDAEIDGWAKRNLFAGS